MLKLAANNKSVQSTSILSFPSCHTHKKLDPHLITHNPSEKKRKKKERLCVKRKLPRGPEGASASVKIRQWKSKETEKTEK